MSMSATAPPGARARLLHDLGASVVVFLVALPLSLGIALAAGAPLGAGIVAAVVGSVVVGLLGGAPLQVSGAATGLTVIVAGLVGTYGWRATCAITVAAGVVQVVLGLLRVARAALVLSPAVVHGMLAGIGVVVALSQLHVMLGGAPRGAALANLADLPGGLAGARPGEVAVGAVTLAVLVTWPALRRAAEGGAGSTPGRVRSLVAGLARVPAALVAVVAGTLTACAPGAGAARVSLPEVTASLPVLPAGHAWTSVAVAILTVAVVASVESLLSAVAVDRMHHGPRADLDRELVGQGAGNVVSGLLGGLPVAGGAIRSSANVRAGAVGRTATVLHGVWVLVFTAGLGALVEQIPLAALAALVMAVGVRMVDRAHIRHALRHREFAVYAATAGGVVILGVLEGLLLGVAVAVVVALYRLAHSTVRVHHRDGALHVEVHGSLTFLSVPRLSRALDRLPDGEHVVLDMTVDYLDQAAFEAVHLWRSAYIARGGHVDVEEIHDGLYGRAADGEPDRRRAPLTPSPRWFAPWWHWQGLRVRRGHPPAHPLLAGAREFQLRTAPLVRPFLARLAHEGQNPAQLFITCADSRVVPNLITASGPGDLFTVRNVGNLVPSRHGDGPGPGATADDSVGAAVEYAVSVLGVRSITVCGHSGCGAMQALLAEAGETPAHAPARTGHGGETPHLSRWLGNGAASLRRFRDGAAPGIPGRDLPPAELLCLANVVQQLDNLLGHPVVRRAVEDGQLRLFGLYFDLATASMYVHDPATGRFEPVDAGTGTGAPDSAGPREPAGAGAEV